MDFINARCIRGLTWKARLLVLFLAAINFIPFDSTVAQSRSGTRGELEQLLAVYLEGCSERDFQKLQASMADVSLARMRNNLVSLKKDFPPSTPDDFDAWDGISASYFKYDKMSFVALKESGRRAILTFRCPAMMTDDAGEHDGLFTADFVRLGEKWKVVKTGGVVRSALMKELDQGNRSFLEQPNFTPNGDIPEMPPIATPADYIAQCQWYIPSGKLTVTVNGIPNEITSMSGFSVILGGLKKGDNKIKIQYDPDHESNRTRGYGDPKLRIKAFTGNSLKTGTDRQIFVYNWKKGEVLDHETSVRIDDEILRTLAPPKSDY